MTDQHLIERFLHHEARLADTHDYKGWEALWTDDGVYWVPAAGAVDDPNRMAIIHDNRHRISTRIKQLETGKRYAQSPPSRLTRIVSNIDVVGPIPNGDLQVEANFVLLESRESGTETWGGRIEYHLRQVALAGDNPIDGVRMSFKRVDLVNRPWVVPTLGFVI